MLIRLKGKGRVEHRLQSLPLTGRCSHSRWFPLSSSSPVFTEEQTYTLGANWDVVTLLCCHLCKKHIRALRQRRKLSRSPTGGTVGMAGAGERRPWQRRVGPQGQTAGRCLSPQPAFRVESPSSQAWQRPAHPSRLSPNVLSQESGLGLHSSYWLPMAVLTALGKDPACSAP